MPTDDPTDSKAARQACESAREIAMAALGCIQYPTHRTPHHGFYCKVASESSTCGRLGDAFAAVLDAKDAEIEAAREQEREAWRSLAVTGCDIHRNVAGALHAAGGMPGCPACHRKANAENVVLKANAATHAAALRALQGQLDATEQHVKILQASVERLHANHAEDLRVAVEQAREEGETSVRREWEASIDDFHRLNAGAAEGAYDRGAEVGRAKARAETWEEAAKVMDEIDAFQGTDYAAALRERARKEGESDK